MMGESASAKRVQHPLVVLQEYVERYSDKQLLPEKTTKRSAGYFAFAVGGKRFIVRMNQVAEVVKALPQITALPFSPKWLLGLSSLRGDVFSVIDFKDFVSDDVAARAKGQSEVAYVVFAREAEGYVFKVDEILGIKNCEVGHCESEYRWLDGKAEVDGDEYFQINFQQLMADASFIQSMH